MLNEFSKLSEFQNPLDVVLISERHRVLVERLNMEVYLPIDPAIPLNKGYEHTEEYQCVFSEISSKGFIQKKYNKDEKRVYTVIVPYGELEVSRVNNIINKAM